MVPRGKATVVNGLGVHGRGVGGIEAEAVRLVQGILMLIPRVVGFRLRNEPPEGVTATNRRLWVTKMLRAHGVVSKFVKYFGPGLGTLLLADREAVQVDASVPDEQGHCPGAGAQRAADTHERRLARRRTPGGHGDEDAQQDGHGGQQARHGLLPQDHR